MNPKNLAWFQREWAFVEAKLNEALNTQRKLRLEQMLMMTSFGSAHIATFRSARG
jgi:hypothetical protein